MIRKGDILFNPVSRETITFLQTAEDSRGFLLQLDINMAPGINQCHWGMHMHPKQKETLFLKSGKLFATLNGVKSLYKAGDIIQIAAGTPHKLENASEQEELNFICEITPAVSTEKLFETALALSQAGKFPIGKAALLLQAALTLNKYRDHIYLAAYPLWLQKLAFRIMAPLALLLGYKAEKDYKKEISKKSAPSLLYG